MSIPPDPTSPKPAAEPRALNDPVAADRTVGQPGTGSAPAGPISEAGAGGPGQEGDSMQAGLVDSEPPDSVGAVVTDTVQRVPGGRVSDGGADSRSPAAVSRSAQSSGDPSPLQVADYGAPPSFKFFGIVAAISLVADVGSKAWAEVVLGQRTLLDPAIVLVPDQLRLTLAYNRGGAWGLLQDAGDNLRRPFFLLVSLLAIAFIVSLYSRLAPGQRALKWGLPLVLGGALGNLSDRIVRGSVIDFIDYRAGWVESMNTFISSYLWKAWTVTDHWPTFNVADISICVGVGLMAVDMVASKRGHPSANGPNSDRPEQDHPAQADSSGNGSVLQAQADPRLQEAAQPGAGELPAPHEEPTGVSVPRATGDETSSGGRPSGI
jgi:signal peptidase II